MAKKVQIKYILYQGNELIMLEYYNQHWNDKIDNFYNNSNVFLIHKLIFKGKI